MLVVDSCALFEVAEQTELGKAFAKMILEDERLVSIDFVKIEQASVIRKMMLRGVGEGLSASERLERALNLIDDYYPVGDLVIEALNESIRLNHSVYDMAYFVLTRRLGATLLTSDRTLEKLCLDNGVNCVARIEL